MFQRFEDLRFSIGIFFLIVGALLLVAHFSHDASLDTAHLNLITGSGLIVFSVVILAFAFCCKPEQK